MTALTICLMTAGIASAVAAALAFVWAARSGHLDDLEETKFRMFREEQDR